MTELEQAEEYLNKHNIDIEKYAEKGFKELTDAERKRAALDVMKTDDFDLQRLYDWLTSENREPAQTKFTAGLLRNVAREIEFQLSDKRYK